MSPYLFLIPRVGVRALALFVGLVLVVGGLAFHARPAAAASGTVTATGRFAYVDDTGATVGIRNAQVEMCDDDGSTGCPTMSIGTTDANGFFSLTGTGGDFFDDLPDPMVKVTASGPSGFVQPVTVVDYCYASAPRNNVGNTSISFGTVTPAGGRGCSIFGGSTAGTDGAWQLWNNVREAWEFMRTETLRNPGREVPQVRVIWPAPMSSARYRDFYLPGLDSGVIEVDTPTAFNEPVIFHEYGHHIMRWFGESPLPNYNNGVCDTIRFLNFGGHCFWRSENSPVAWTEGWPDFLSEVLTTSLSKNQTMSSVFGPDVITPAIRGSVEAPPLPSPDSNLANVEGTVAALMWDLMDSAADNRDGNNSTDQMNLSFASLWDVFMNRDPDPFTAHNKILNTDELWEAFAALRPSELNRVSEVFHENGLSKPASDLSVTGVSTSAATAVPGQSITVTDTTANVGAVRTGLSSVTRVYLKQGVFGSLVPLGVRIVGDLQSGGTASSGATNVVIPSASAPGDYFVVACADDSHINFESNEGNNCLSSSPISVNAPSISIGDASVTEGNAGTVALNFPVTLSTPAQVSVDYATADGTAKAPGDYAAAAGTLSFGPNDPTTQTVTVYVNGDVLDEALTETLKVNLSGAVGATIGDGMAVGRITDDDLRPSLRINNVTLSEGNAGLKNFSFRVSLSAISGRRVKVNWNTVDGMALAGSDYVAAQGQLTIPAGTPYVNVPVKVIGDLVLEPNEGFRVKLSTPVNATIADDSGRGIIVNDD